MEINVGDVFEDKKGYTYKVIQQVRTYYYAIVERTPPYAKSDTKKNEAMILIRHLSSMRKINV